MSFDKIITLSNLLRKEGMSVSVRCTLTASEIWNKYNEEFTARQQKQALRSIYVKNKQDDAKFSIVYDQLFNENKIQNKQKSKYKKTREINQKEDKNRKIIETDNVDNTLSENRQIIEERNQRKIVNDKLTHESIALLDNFDNRIFDICQKLSRKIANQRNKRRKIARSHKISMPHTIRYNLKNGGHLIKLLNQKPPLRKNKQIFLCDVSGSCRWVSSWFFAILYGCYRTFDKMTIYDFDNRLVDVTGTLGNDFKNIYEINSSHQTCGIQAYGQSDMAKSFKQFLKVANLNKHTDVIILTDCRDWKGKHENGVLESASLVHEMVNNSRNVIILNPEKKIRWNTPTSCVEDYIKAGASVYETCTLDQFAQVISKL